MTYRWLLPVIGAGFLALTAVSAQAHSPYLAPFNFAPYQPVVTVHAALTGNAFFTPEFPIRGDRYEVTDAAGKVTEGTGISLTELSVFEASLPAEGTYRISTGNRDVRTLNVAQVDGEWKAVRMPVDGVVPPPFADQSRLLPGAEIVPVRTMVRSETYVSYNKPSEKVPPPAGEGLEIAPVTHPNKLFAGQPFDFHILFNGALVPADYTVYRAQNDYAETAFSLNGETGTGVAQIVFETPGLYVIEVRRRWLLGPREDARTWIHTLTLEVTP